MFSFGRVNDKNSTRLPRWLYLSLLVLINREHVDSVQGNEQMISSKMHTRNTC